MGKVRSWKSASTERASALNRSAALHTSWAQKTEERAKRRQVQLQQRALNEEIAKEKRMERARIEEKRRRREENRLKSGKLQVIKDPKKIKKMSKKQLRNVVTADTTGVAPVDKGAGTEVHATKRKR
mmetsp:Transcript_19383/g.64990  ORF Transcript_19383/g.64990 Transcript_19383/m.64990 type:complete len:127 (-) Transcript_19383:303-683(-)